MLYVIEDSEVYHFNTIVQSQQKINQDYIYIDYVLLFYYILNNLNSKKYNKIHDEYE